jgi:predicted DNA-binding transcriptional regulator AlpA
MTVSTIVFEKTTTVYNKPKDELVGVKEIAELLGIDRATVASWRHQGRLPNPDYKISGIPVWFACEIIFWVHHNDYIKNRCSNIPPLMEQV